MTGSILTSAVQINGGTLQVSGGNALSNTGVAGVVTIADAAGATFQVVGSETIGALTGGGGTGGAVTIDALQTLTLASGTQTYAGTIGGAGILTGAGALQTLNGAISSSGGINANSARMTLGGNNTYTGTTTVSTVAAIILTADNALGATGVGNGTTLLGSGGLPSGVIGLSGGFTYSAAEKIIGSGISNTTTINGLAVNGRGMVQSVSGNNTFAGDIEINSAGITRFGTQDGAQLTLGGSITRSIGVTGTQIFFRAGSNNGDFVTLSGTGNDWGTDDTVIFTGLASGNAGLRLGLDNALPVTTTVIALNTSGAGGSFDLNGFDQTLNGLKVQTGYTTAYKIVNLDPVNASILTLANTLDRTSDVAAITNDGGGVIHVVKTGTFSQGLGATNTYTGNTLVSVGTLQFAKQVSLNNNGAAAAWSNTNINVDSGATMAFRIGGTGEFTKANIITLLGLSTGANGFKTGSILGLDTTSGAFNYDSVIANPNGGANVLGLTKLGTNTLTLSALNTYTGGTFINAGTLKFDGVAIVEPDGDPFAAGDIAVQSGATLEGFRSHFTGGTLTLNGGTWFENNGFGGSWTGAVALSATSIITTPYAQTITGNITGAGGLTKAGVGTLTLNGAGTYAGTTTISAGTLQLGTGTAGQNGTVTGSIVNNATLTFNNADAQSHSADISGTGVVNKSGAGTLNFGVSSGLTGLSALAANNGTTNVNSVLGTGGTSTVSVTGATTTLKFGSVSQTLSSLTIGAGSTVTFTSGLASFSVGGGGKVASLGGSAVVPEPGTLGLLLVGALGVLNRRRRRA